MRDCREDAKVKSQTATKRKQRQTKLHVLGSMEEIVAEYLKSSLIKKHILYDIIFLFEIKNELILIFITRS